MPMKPNEILEELRRLEKEIEDRKQLEASDARSLSRMAATPPDMITAAQGALGTSEEVRNAVGVTSAELLAERLAVSEWSSVEAQLYSMYRGVAGAQLIRRHRIGLITSQTFQIARQLARHPRHSELLSYVESMEQHNKFGRRKKRKAESEPVSD